MRRPLLLATAAMIGLLGLPAAAVAAPATDTTQTTLDPELLSKTLDAITDAGAPSVIAEVRDGDDVWADASGERDKWTKTPTKSTDLVRVASITKSMVTTVVLQLVESGDLHLSDTIQDRVPGLVPYTEPITVENLLGHTSGIPDYFPEVFPSFWEGKPDDVKWQRWLPVSPEKLIDSVSDQPLHFTPGEMWSYSNTGYVVLGLMIEDITGNSLERELKTRVLQPAGMGKTQLPTWNPFIMGPHPRAQFATGYSEEPYYDTTEMNPSIFWSAGHAVAPVSDINNLYAALSDGTLLSRESLATMRTLSPQSGGTYGLGLQALPVGGCDDFPDGVAFGHTGGALGASSFSFHSPDGERQLTFTYLVDDQFDPNPQLAAAMGNFLNAALCDVDTTGGVTTFGGDNLGDMILDRWTARN